VSVELVGGEQDDDDDDVMLDPSDSQMISDKDPFSTLPLKMVVVDGVERWPLALPCGHVYNYETIMATGRHTLKKCAVAACDGHVPKDKSILKEDNAVKHQLKRKQLMGAHARVHAESIMLEDDLEEI